MSTSKPEQGTGCRPVLGILITARLGSTRLKRKHLLLVSGKPMMSFLLLRIEQEFTEELAAGHAKIIIATSDEPMNREFEQFCSPTVSVFYGSKSNIPLRHFEAAQAVGFDLALSIDGDDILCSRRAMRAVSDSLLSGSQYASTNGLPFGMNAFGYSVAFLKRSLEGHRDQTLETGWGRIFDTSQMAEIQISDITDDPLLRFTLDYPEDHELFGAVISAFADKIFTASDAEIVEHVYANDLHRLTSAISEEYWNIFRRSVEAEEGRNE